MVYIRKLKKLFVFILSLIMLCSMLCLQAFAAEPIEYNSPSVIVTELISGTTIISEQPDMPIAPGEIAKIAALYVVVKECFAGNISMDDIITITSDVLASDSGAIPLKEGEVFTVEQLMYLAYMDYSNTAAYALAVHTAGSVDNFIAKMNDVVKSAGCENTVFTTVTGYYSEGQTTTPEDIVTLVKMAIQNTIFKQVFTTVNYIVPETNLSIPRNILTSNKVQQRGSSYGSEYCVGGKQGGHKDVGYTTVTLSELTDDESEDKKKDEQQMELIVIVSGTMDASESYADAYNIIEWAFANYSWNTIVHSGEAIERVPVEMANGTDYVVVGPAEDINALVDNAIEITQFNREVIIYPPDEGDTYIAPIARGEVLGELTVSYGNTVYGRVPLVANQEVRLRHWAYFKSEFSASFKDSGIMKIVIVVCVLIAAYIIYSLLFWYRRITKKREANIVKKQLIAARKEGRMHQIPTVVAKEEQADSAEVTVDKISGILDESVEIGDMSEPDMSEIADVVSSEDTENNDER